MKSKRANLTSLVSMWYPHADVDTLKDLTYFRGWMFLVDDALDKVCGPDPEKVRAFDGFCNDTVVYMEASLGLQPSGEGKPTKTLAPGVDSFQKTAEALCARYAPGE